MIMSFRNLLIILLLFEFSSCFQASRRVEFCKLNIALDTSSNFYLDTISVTAKYNHYSSDYQSHDSTIGRYAYTFGLVEKGKIKIQLTSFLNKTFIKEVDLAKDTTIIITANELNNFQDIEERKLPSFDLAEGDTLVVGLKSLGCFHFYKENVIVSKNNGKYTIAFNNTRPRGYGLGNMNLKRQFNLEFADTLNMFSVECKKLLKRPQTCFSTTSAFIYIRKGNLVYKLPDIGCGDWDGYNRLVAALDPPWPKLEQ
jgi:hypothetical protein